VTGTPQEPAKVGISVADIAGGMYAFSGVLTALFARERTGEGASLEVSLFDALSEWMSQPMYYAMYTGVPPERTGTSHATIAPYGTFRTGDGAVQLAIQNQREWTRLCTEVLNRPLLLEDARFASNADRVEHRAELSAEIERALAGLNAEETIRLLDKANIANGSFNTVLDLLDHPQLQQARRWVPVDSPVGQLKALRPPTNISGFEASMGAIPGLGQHTQAILQELGFDSDQTHEWQARGAV
jgi:itaconate CoA-transferase